MSRVERFRQNRRLKFKIAACFFIFLVTIFTGISTADYSINSIMKNETRIKVFTLEEFDNNYIKISIMNKALYVNTSYIKRDYNRVREFIKKSINQ